MSAGPTPRSTAAGPGESSVLRDVISPVTGTVLGSVRLAGPLEIQRLLRERAGDTAPLDRREVLDFLHRLKEQLLAHQRELIRTTIFETGFITADSREIVTAAIEFLADFETYAEDQAGPPTRVPHSYAGKSSREMLITHRPYRWIAAVVPQNASLTLGITIIASALYAGSRVLLRPSLQCGCTGALLAELVERSEPPGSSVLIVNCLATDFLDACYTAEQVDVIHYIGSNQFALPVLMDAYAARKLCLLDGQGNGMLYLDETFPIEHAVDIVTCGATRFNGETCTSVNGVLIQQEIYEPVRDALVDVFGALRVGDPTFPETEIGPMFSREQAAGLARALRAGSHMRLLCGGSAEGAYLAPAIVEGVVRDDLVVRQGLFGPALWIQPVRDGELFDWLRANQFPLGDAILSTRPELVRAFAAQSRAARICVNEDPSVESMFEPWGGYPPSGLNPVSIWIDKYRQAFQLDGRLGLDRADGAAA